MNSSKIQIKKVKKIPEHIGEIFSVEIFIENSPPDTNQNHCVSFLDTLYSQVKEHIETF
ncbi:hypothetical protein [uncultured Robinsoniella sp.]|uniref:hypothetical protein n=1 Tax=uncultured Robinsoniella sp. TaxID=904190 RepID=UPI00374E618E